MAKILLMEDDYEEASLLSELLSELGHIVVTTHEATSALNIYGTSSFDLIITDVLVRGANQKKGGIFLIGAIRCQEVATKNHQPILAISGAASLIKDCALETQMENIGADMFMQKPVMVKELEAGIAQLLYQTP